MIKAFFGWIFRIFARGLLKKWESKKVDKLEREKDAYKGHAESVEEGKDLEKAAGDKQRQVKKDFEEKAKNRPADDPFGTDDWNEKK